MLAQPPRSVSLSLRLRILLSTVTTQGGWLGLTFVVWLAAGASISRHGKPPGRDDFHLALLLPVAAVAMIPLILGTRRSWRHVRLLSRGIETHGKLVSKREIANAETSFWHYTFEYRTAAGTTHRMVVITDVPEKTLEDDALEPMVYDPTNPDVATTLDHLPGAPKIRDGQLMDGGGGALLFVLPLATIAGIVTFAVLA